MSDAPKKRLDLGRTINRGRAFGAMLAAGANPTFFASEAQVKDAITGLLEAERRLKDGTPLWEREWICTAVRCARLAAPRADDPADTLARCQAIEARLQAADDQAFAEARARLAKGAYDKAALISDLAARPSVEWDAYVKRLFQIDAAPSPEIEQLPGMVRYIPSPTASILEVAALVGPDDVFYDVGSGLGLVTIMVAWLSGARCRGVEREPAYHKAAIGHAERFASLRVEPILSDARELDYRDATAIYFYDSMRGELLDALLDRIAAIPHPFKLISRGFGTPQIAQRPWARDQVTTSTGLAVFHCKPA